MDKHGGNIYRFDHKMWDFSANLNPLGMPEAVSDAVIANMEQYSAYPDPHSTELREAISRFHGVEKDQICCGNGAADLIFRITMAFRPKKALIIAPTFLEYKEALDLADCETAYYHMRREDGFTLVKAGTPEIGTDPGNSPSEDVMQGRYDMVFLCSPNNPTGIPVKKELVLELADACRKTSARLILDECFMDFVSEEEQYSILPVIRDLPSVIILKSFTKIFAMAGLRLGYCICGNPEDAQKISSCMQAWPVSTVNSKAGTAALSVPGFIEKTRQYVKGLREELMSGLKALGLSVYPSQANYVFFFSPVPLDEPLLKYDILIRNCSNYEGLEEGYYRVAVRTEEENQYLLAALKQILKGTD